MKHDSIASIYDVDGSNTYLSSLSFAIFFTSKPVMPRYFCAVVTLSGPGNGGSNVKQFLSDKQVCSIYRVCNNLYQKFNLRLITKRTALDNEWYDIVAVGNKEPETEVPLVNWKT